MDGVGSCVPTGTLVGIAMFAACGGHHQSATGTSNVPPSSPSFDAGVGRALYGLDVRPSNKTCLAPDRPAQAVKLTPVFTNLTFQNPVLMLQAPGDTSKWYVVEQGTESTAAGIRVFDNTPDVSTTSDFVRFGVTDITRGPPVNEGGLLAFAFHPDYANNGTAFLSYTAPSATSSFGMKALVTRIKKVNGSTALDRTTEETLVSSDGRPLSIDKPGLDHNNCTLDFGNDGNLYIGFGDGGDETLGAPAQDKTGYFGKILRIHVGPTGPYTIPSDNPWMANPLGIGELKETWAYGFRNPWRWSFDRVTGDLWAGDVGDDRYEEVDLVLPGRNYGWPIVEGRHCYSDPACDKTGLTDPVVEYPHENNDRAVMGGYVYRGNNIPFLVGSYVFADMSLGRISRIVNDPATGAAQIADLTSTGFAVSSMGQGLDGELYVIDYAGGRLWRIDPAASGPRPVPATLSATGCVNPTNPKEPADGLIPYDVNMPLWSDGADKKRWLAIPDGTTIQVGPDGHWDLPIGSVLMKQFSLGGTLVETRLFVHHQDGDWAGYTYAWNDTQTDATLVPVLTTKNVGGQEWSIPGRSHCLQCHASVAGRSLGTETGQLNGDVLYPSTQRIANQLATLDHIGMFDVPIGDPAVLVRYPKIDSGDPLDQRARAYVHANCQHCHRPGGGTQMPIDFRYATPFAAMGLCGVDPNGTDLGVFGAKLLVPGNPAASVVSLRMHSVDPNNRMPPEATQVVHAAGTDLVDSWIRSLTSCQ